MRVIDETEDDLRRLIAADFGLASSGRAFSSEFIDWLHYKARNIPSVKRTVVMSSEVTAHLVQFPAVTRIRAALLAGIDVSPWLSNRVRTSKDDPAADMLFNDWQIVHFHLGSVFASARTIKRTDELLFAYITGIAATLIDVQPHGAWTQTSLLDILLRTTPMAGYQMQGVTPHRFTDEEYKNFRAHHTNSLIDVGGKALMPGMGIMSSGHAMRITLYHRWFERRVEGLRAAFEADQVPDHLKPAIYAAIGVPVRLGAWYHDQGLAVIDKNRHGLVLYQMRPLE